MVAPAGSDEKKTHTDVLLFNRWSYDDVQVPLSPLLLFQFIFISVLLWVHSVSFCIGFVISEIDTFFHRL